MLRLLALLAFLSTAAFAQEGILGSGVYGGTGGQCGVGGAPACMASFLSVTGTVGKNQSNSATNYLPLANPQSQSGWTTTATMGTPMSTTGVISNAQCAVFAPDIVSTSQWAFTLYKNGSPTSIVCTIVYNTYIGQDITHTVTFIPGDYFYWQSVPTNSPTVGSATLSVKITDASNVGNEAPMCFSTGDASNAVNGDYYSPLASGTAYANDNGGGFQFPTAGIVDNLYVYRNTTTGTTHYTAYKNGSATSLVADAVSATQGSDTNPGHAITVALGDSIAVVPSAGTGSPPSVPLAACWRWRPTTPGQYVVGGDMPAGMSVATRYMGGVGYGIAGTTPAGGGLTIPFAYDATSCASQCMTWKTMQITATPTTTSAQSGQLYDRSNGGTNTFTNLTYSFTGTNGGNTGPTTPAQCSCSITIGNAAASASNVNTLDFMGTQWILAASGTNATLKWSAIVTVP